MKIGKQTIQLVNRPAILNTGSIVGPKEAEGPLAEYFDTTIDDVYYDEDTFEKAESKLIKQAVWNVLSKENLDETNIDYLFAGDLLNQCISSGYAIRDLGVPFMGLYGACSTFVEGLSLGAIFTEGFAQHVLCAASSHFCSAEKQFRFPLELGNQRPPSSQWTVTGSGAAIISKSGDGPSITHITTGKIVDMGIKDANNMGAAMAPAALDTLICHFKDTGRTPNYYDAIITGDLGYIGKEILTELALDKGYNIKSNYNDCGVMIFDKEQQDTHSGGSGCGCCATVFSGYFFKELKDKKMKRLLLIATGALTNSTTSQQGESIPGIAHAISIEM